MCIMSLLRQTAENRFFDQAGRLVPGFVDVYLIVYLLLDAALNSAW